MSDDAALLKTIDDLANTQPVAEEFLHDVVHHLAQHMAGWDWVGIYVLVGETLVLGPFIGAPTELVRIAAGVGVCGTAVARDVNIRVDDVGKLDLPALFAQDAFRTGGAHSRRG